MLILLTYDVNVASPGGAKRLRRVAKVCEKFGVRVQNSVFELLVDPAQLVAIKAEIIRVIDAETDSVRFYRLGKNYANKVEQLGKEPLIQQNETIIL